MMGLMLCLYLVLALYVLAENVSPRRARRDPVAVARNVLEALIWPLALLRWREWSWLTAWWRSVTSLPIRYGELV